MKKNWKKAICDRIEQVIETGSTRIGSVDDAVTALLLTGFPELLPGRPVVYLSAQMLEAERIARDVALWRETLNLSCSYSLLPEGSGRDRFVSDSDAPRMRVLDEARLTPASLYLCTAAGALGAAPPLADVISSEFVLRPGMNLRMSDFLERLMVLDYDDELEVTQKGEFVKRGGIVDVYSVVEKHPVRLEFWGDTIETMRYFNTTDQRTIGDAESYRVVLRSGNAAREKTNASDFFEYIRHADPVLVERDPEDVRRHLETFSEPELVAKWDAFRGTNCFRTIRLYRTGEAAPESDMSLFRCFPPGERIRADLDLKRGEDAFSEVVRIRNANLIRQWVEEKTEVTLLCEDESEELHLGEWLEEQDLRIGAYLNMERGTVPCGVFLPEDQCAVLTVRELFSGWRSRRNPMQSRSHTHGARTPDGEPEVSHELADLDEGDYAVHLNYGICLYKGLRIVESAGARKEMIRLEFDDDKIMDIPVWHAYLLSRYIGAKKDAVRLSRLHSTRWSKAKAEAQDAVRTLAFEMLRMQAIRSEVKGSSFPRDDLAQHLFEESFPFDETPDQMRASEEIKRDMESERPMDRLLCGDVGYGKTEVAIRAVHKCVMSGRQAAILVPTTVLAQQHYYSLLERFAGIPVIIEQLSRFRTKAQQTDVIRRLKEGAVDIVVGTHRLVQGDVDFHDLGLLVIDEEQRFGVEHKERLKKLRSHVDVLTMTATPIPRTLYFSLAGLRDLSTIMSAPVQRLPVKTVVTQFSPEIIANAVKRELERGGQVYFLHNRVKTIDDAAGMIAGLVPEARIAVGHGQMPEEELEQIMSDFIEGKIDVLVSTTIIESGLDIPNANTILIDRADRFGLAELYQLRGRVGRWSRQAYAYLLLPKSGILAGDALKRLSAVRRFTYLGAGFQLALRDMEIRGAGNLLGAEQSGQINAIGYHLYCQLLKDCVNQFRGILTPARVETELFTDFVDYALAAAPGRLAASFPPDYINSPRLRIDAYRRCSGLVSAGELDRFRAELRDRFGRLPEEVETFLTLQRIRIEASRAGIDTVSTREGRIYLERRGTVLKPDGRVPRLDSGLSVHEKLRILLKTVTQIADATPLPMKGGRPCA